MKNISNIIIDEQPVSGVYWVGVESPQGELATIDNIEFYKLFHIRGERIHTLQEYLDEAQTVMDSADYCNYSLDTLLDCMRGIQRPSAPINLCVFLYDNVEVFAESSPSDFQVLLEVFKDATEAWRERLPKKRMYVLLAGNKDYVDAIPPLNS